MIIKGDLIRFWQPFWGRGTSEFLKAYGRYAPKMAATVSMISQKSGTQQKTK